jgi:formyltetrahydrofolate synthetase
VEIIRRYGVPVVVAINAFPTDTGAEHVAIRETALSAGATDAVVCTNWAEGGRGAENLAAAVWNAASTDGGAFSLLSPDDLSLKEKIETVATRIYGAAGVDFTPAATKALAEYTALGYGHLPVCMAKTHLSLTHDPTLKGRPTGYRFPVRDVRLSAGAGFIYPLAGDMRTMPGLPSHPAGEKIDIDENGEVVGLF